MPKRMLIDASHPEETRVVVLDGQKVEEFDFEAASKRPLKGNIYLAKVTRVEPSLQAAFVEYGGNRQGFLAFSEIHPDYYQIPVADRMALLAEQEAEARRRSDDEFESFETASAPAQSSVVREDEAPVQDASDDEADADEYAPSAPSEQDESRPSEFAPADDGANGEEAAAAEQEAVEGGDGEAEQPQDQSRDTSQQASIRATSDAALGPSPALQNPGSDQAPPSHSGAGGQRRTRQQGRRAHNLSLACRTLLRADAEHAARRRHLAQDHERRRPQAAENRRSGARTARRHGPHHPHGRRKPHQGRDQARL